MQKGKYAGVVRIMAKYSVRINQLQTILFGVRIWRVMMNCLEITNDMIIHFMSSLLFMRIN